MALSENWPKKKPTSLSQGLQRSPTRIISFLNLGFQRFHTNTLTICVLKIRYSKKLKTQTPIAPIAFTACRATTSAPPSCAALRSTASRRSMFCSGVAKLVNGNAKEPENPKCPAVRMPFGRVYSWRMDIFGGPTNCGTGGGQLTDENLLLLEGSSMKCIVNNGHFHSVCQWLLSSPFQASTISLSSCFTSACTRPCSRMAFQIFCAKLRDISWEAPCSARLTPSLRPFRYARTWQS